MDNVVDFTLLRIQLELEKYQKTKTLPHDLLEGAYSIDDIKDHYYEKLSPKHKKIADRLLKEYDRTLTASLDTLKLALRKDYVSVMSNLKTDHTDFMFPSVLNKYRKDINPVKALYYEAREVFRSYNPENPLHVWLIDLITDHEYNNKIIDALSVDIKKLEKIVSRYYLPMIRYTENIPLELFHARQLVKDFRHYLNVFNGARKWERDE